MPDDTTKPPGGGTEPRSDLPMLVYKGEVIHERREMLSLTDMWKAAGSDPSKQPAKWRELPSSKDFAAHVAGVILRKSEDEIFKVARGGRQPQTWAHWQIGIAYAKYLDHDFHMWCNTAVRERMEGASCSGSAIASDLGPDARRAVGGIVKSVVPGIVAEALAIILPGMLEKQLEADSRAVAIGFKPALLVLIEKKVPPRRRRAFSQKVSARLRRFSADHGFETRISRESGRWLFQIEAINAWLAHEGERLIRDHIASLDGQGTLRLVTP